MASCTSSGRGGSSKEEMPLVSDLRDAVGLGSLKLFLDSNGYCAFRGLIESEAEVLALRKVYDELLETKSDYKCDLGANESRKKSGVENITQVMWPSELRDDLKPDKSKLHQRALRLAKALIGDDAEFDFDMIINKVTDTATPFHVDAAYWPDAPDTRALSFWVALDPVDEDRGCMWYGPRTHLEPLRRHRSSASGAGALMCDGSEDECVPVPMEPGDVGIHSGRTLHYSRGNKTGLPRRAYIMNFRPKAMIEHFRALGFDHGKAGGASGNHVVKCEEAEGGDPAGDGSGGTAGTTTAAGGAEAKTEADAWAATGSAS